MAQSHSVRNRPRVGKGLDPFQKTVNEFTKEKPEKNFQGRKRNGTKPFLTKAHKGTSRVPQVMIKILKIPKTKPARTST